MKLLSGVQLPWLEVLDALVDIPEELRSGSPFWRVGRIGFCRNDFFGGHSVLFQCRDLVPRRNQQVAVLGKLCLVADTTMAGDDDCFGGAGREVVFGGLDHAIDMTAG